MLNCTSATWHDSGLARQQGSVLIIALVFLLVMTMIGTIAMQGTTQQERMAGNYWDRNLAFQAAEAALSRGGQVVQTAGAALPLPSGTPTTPAWNQDASWWANNSTAVTGITGVNLAPRFVVQNLGSSTSSEEFGATSVFLCQVIARATGGSDTAVVILVENRECGI